MRDLNTYWLARRVAYIRTVSPQNCSDSALWVAPSSPDIASEFVSGPERPRRTKQESEDEGQATPSAIGWRGGVRVSRGSLSSRHTASTAFSVRNSARPQWSLFACLGGVVKGYRIRAGAGVGLVRRVKVANVQVRLSRLHFRPRVRG